MNDFIKLLFNNPIVIKLTLGLLFIVALLFIIGFFQGREISFWPPKIGALQKQSSENPQGTKNQNESTKNNELSTIEENIDPLIKQDIIIKINTPENGETVSQFTAVEYSIKGQIPEGYKPLLIVGDPLGQYWSWGYLPADSHKRVQFGMPEDSQKEFEIGVLVTNRDFPKGQPTHTLPGGIAFKSIIVIRK